VKVRALLKNGSIYLAVFAALVGCTGDSASDDRLNGQPDGPTIHVQVRPGGALCAVQTVEVKCDEVAHHLHDVLKVKLNEYIAVEVDTSREPIPFDSMTTVINSLKQSGFTMVIGSVPLPKGGAS
jgi:biopolymer transport protein ExbD